MKFATPTIVEDLEVIHYGNSIYKSEEFKPILNQMFIKPLGGLWTSPVISTWSWRDWCASQEYGECIQENSFNLKFNKDAKILIIESYQDLEEIVKDYRILSDPLLKFFTILDFEKLRESCDAIWLTEEGQRQTHLSTPLSLYGWDCESILIMNSDCCYQVKE